MPQVLAIADADAAITAFVKGLKLEYPELGLSYGYIGNVYRDGTDDRSFRIFTNRRSDCGRSVSYWLGGVGSLPGALERLPAGFAKFAALAKTQSRV